MRLQYGTLDDHLSRQTLRDEIAIARLCEQAEPGYLRRTADSYGRLYDYSRPLRRSSCSTDPSPIPTRDCQRLVGQITARVTCREDGASRPPG